MRSTRGLSSTPEDGWAERDKLSANVEVFPVFILHILHNEKRYRDRMTDRQTGQRQDGRRRQTGKATRRRCGLPGSSVIRDGLKSRCGVGILAIEIIVMALPIRFESVLKVGTQPHVSESSHTDAYGSVDGLALISVASWRPNE